MGGASESLRRLADVLESLEGTSNDHIIHTAKPNSEDWIGENFASIQVAVEIPLVNKDAVGEEMELRIEGAQFTDSGSLQVDFSASTATDGRSGVGVVSGSGRQITESDSETDDSEDAGPAENVGGEDGDTASDSANETEISGTDEPQEEPDQPQEEDDGPESVTPAYQDPNRLREVYEEYDTFSEMTDALDVDVTPQTVRRYMIKHDIHSPMSSTGSEAVASLIDGDPDDIPVPKKRDRPGQELSSMKTEREDVDATSFPEDHRSETSTRPTPDGGTPRSENYETGREVTTHEDEKPSTGQSDDKQRDSREGPVSRATASSVLEVENGRGDTAGIEILETHSGVEAEIDTTKINLPDQITLGEVKEGVLSAQTLYEAQQRLDLSRDRTRQLLQDLSLIDLVVGRVGDYEKNRKTPEEVDRRILSAVATDEERA